MLQVMGLYYLTKLEWTKCGQIYFFLYYLVETYLIARILFFGIYGDGLLKNVVWEFPMRYGTCPLFPV